MQQLLLETEYMDPQETQTYLLQLLSLFTRNPAERLKLPRKGQVCVLQGHRHAKRMQYVWTFLYYAISKVSYVAQCLNRVLQARLCLLIHKESAWKPFVLRATLSVSSCRLQ